MFDLGNFLLESGVSLVLFYLLYWLLLRKQTFFSLNRAVLLFTTLLSLALPFIRITLPAATPEKSVLYVMDQFSLEGGVWLTGQITAPVGNSLSMTDVLFMVYLAGLLFFSVRFLAEIFHILVLVRNNRVVLSDGFRVVLVSKHIAPFSFFRWIFITEEAWEHSRQEEIMSHEMEHLRKGHSIDMLLLGILTIIQWFNPFAWMYKWTLRELHEYEADNEILRKGTNTLQYQNLILQQIFGVQFFRFVNHLNQSYLKKRFAMMTKNRSGRTAVLRTFSLIPITLLLVALFAFDRNNLQLPSSLLQSDEMAFIAPFGAGENITLTAKFGPMIHPMTKENVQHRGMDFKARQGASILAVAKGKVKKVAMDETAYGHHLVIVHNDTWSSLYAHMDRIDVREGESVSAGQPIGTVGNTGVSTGPHLHLELLKNGDPVDPSLHIPGLQTSVLPEQPLEKFHAAPPAILLQDTTVFKVVEEMPRFQGEDIKAFQHWLMTELRYPEKMKAGHKSATVFVSFVIEPSGKVTRVRAISTRDLNGHEVSLPEFEQEALRAVKSSPGWEPGKQRGKNVAVEITVPIRFKLDGENKKDPALIKTESGEQVFFVVEQMPSFSYMGSDSAGAFRKYVADHMKYPEEALIKGLTGRIFVGFVVEPDGSISDVRLLRGLETDDESLKAATEAMNEEALRVIRESPPWKPGKQRGHTVRVAFTFPIVFALK